MNYIVLDLEWNQCPLGKKYENAALPFEIIEIGAVRLNERFEVTGKFHKLIRPKVYKEIHFMTKQVINLSMKELKNGLPFTIAARELLAFCGAEYIFCTWGSLDLTELQRNMKYYGMNRVYTGPVKFYDIQKLFSLLYEDGKSRSNLKYAVEYMGLNQKGEFHSALNDAFYTAQILQSIDFAKVQGNYSFDCFHIPKTRKDEIHAVFDTYSKFISHGFHTREEMMADREVVSSVCYKCGKRCRKKIRWFSGNNRTYYALAYCEEHGYLKGKIRVRQTDEEEYYAIKTLKLVDEEGAQSIRSRQQQLRQKRKEKRNREVT